MSSKPIRYYDNIELVEFHYGDLLLPSDIYHFVQEGIKTSTTVMMPMNFFEFWDEGENGWYFRPKEYLVLHSTIHNEKGVRLFIKPLIHDEQLIPFIKFPKHLDEYVDKDPRFYTTNWVVISREDNSWIARKRIYMDLNEVHNVTKYRGPGKTFFFGILSYFPDVKYKVAFNSDEINRALDAMPQNIRGLLSDIERSWSWLLNYLDNVHIVYLLGKGHDVAVGYAVTDWLKYFIAGVVR
jgi:hypothetical protein